MPPKSKDSKNIAKRHPDALQKFKQKEKEKRRKEREKKAQERARGAQTPPPKRRS